MHLVAALVAAASLAGTPRPIQLSGLAVLYGSFSDLVAGAENNVFGPGLSGRVSIPLTLEPAFDLEVGLEGYAGLPFQGSALFLGLVPDVSFRWNFYSSAHLALFVKAGAQLDVGIGRTHRPVFPWPSASVGLLVPFSNAVALRFELGWPGVRLGLSFDVR